MSQSLEIQLFTALANYPKALIETQKKYPITKKDFEILSACYHLEKARNRQPYFFAGEITSFYPSCSGKVVYRSLNHLVCNGFLKVSYKTPKANRSNFYIVTGKGESLLLYFQQKLENLNASFF